MNARPVFTIITVTFNSAEFVRDALESVLGSTFTNFEYIIGDDFSSDETWDIINEYEDERIIRYRNEKNIGEYPNRNKALLLATGKWVIYIDGDDIIYSHSLFVLNHILEFYNDIGVAVMCPESPFYVAPLLLNPRELFEIEFSEHGLINRALSHTVYKTSVLKRCQFKEVGFFGLDTLNRLEILMNENCLLIQDNLTWWRRSPNQASKQIDNSLRNEMFEMSYFLFNHDNCPLGKTSKDRYLRNSKIKLVKLLVKFVLRAEFSNSVKLFKANRLHIFDLMYLFFKIDKTNPFLFIDDKIRFSSRFIRRVVDNES